MNILVTDGDQRSTLAVARSLGKRKIGIIIGEDHPGSLAGASRYCKKEIVYPSPADDPSGFQNFIIDKSKRHIFEAVIPMTDITVSLIAEIKSEIENNAIVPIPDKAVFDRASDKRKLIQLAENLDIPVPKTVFINDIDDLNRISRDIDYPVAIKPSRSKVLTPAGWKSTGVEYVSSSEELLEKYLKIHEISPYPLIQKRIYGDGMGIFLLFSNGRPLAAFSHRRIREKPPSGGVSVLRESASLDGHMFEYSRKILEALRWSGVAMVEFKIDNMNNIPRLMEINGRFWGSLQLAIDAGIDFPYLLYQIMEGHEPEPVTEYNTAVRSRWLLGDLDHLRTVWTRSKKNLSLPDNYPGRLRCLLQFLNFFQKDTKLEIWNSDDIRPALRELKQYIRADIKSLWRKIRGSSGSILKGALHIHTDISHDGAMTLAEIRDFFRNKGYGFVCITDHSDDITVEEYQNFTDKCRRLSKSDFLIIPGIEYSCKGEIHILGMGLDEIIDDDNIESVIEQIHAQGGLAILAHPLKKEIDLNAEWIGRLDGIETWNIGYDGKYVPSMNVFRAFESLKMRFPRLLAFTGFDMHVARGYFRVSTATESATLDRSNIIKALKRGSFEVKTRIFSLPADINIGKSKKALIGFMGLAITVLKKLRRLSG